ncbi:MAG TPA: hypothetical protein VMP89_03395 [Solirubrobacteraceae bacterium]|nr:hypothetical protein [Solirubrobacteraceae bacterium]
MPRPRVSVPPEAIRIEDEVWEEAFARREPSESRAARRLTALEGGLAETAPPRRPARPARPARPVAASRPEGTARLQSARIAEEPLPARAIAPAAPAAGPAGPAGAPTPDRSPGAGVAGRRTVTIRGRGAERNLPWPDASSRRRPPRRAYERAGFKPDRVAMWAVFLGMLLVLVAVLSAHG